MEPSVVEHQLTPDDHAASEVSIAADPSDPDHLVAAANSAGPEEAGFGVYETRDAGGTWTASMFTPDQVRSEPAEGPAFQSLSDPVVAFGPGGELYLAGLAFLPTSAVFVAVSPDGDSTFEESHVAFESDVVARFNDKEWIAASPATGTLLLTWQMEPALDQLRSVEAATGLDVDVGEIVVARSTDAGASWSEPEVVSRGLHNNGTQVTYTEGGVAQMAWVNYETHTLDHIRSTDDGVSWSDPAPIATVRTVPPFERYARMHTLPALVSQPNGSGVYAVWHDARSGDADIYAVASGDGGQTWGPEVRVNDDTVSEAIQFYPWATVAPDGDLHVTWYDAREDPDTPGLRFYHASAPGPGLAFSPNEPISNATIHPFADDPGGSAISLGDYTGLAASQSGVFPAWASVADDRAVVHAARIG